MKFSGNMSECPKDGTILLLIVEGGNHPLEDISENCKYVTCGFNNFDSTGEDIWETMGWNWSHYCIVESTPNNVLAWSVVPNPLKTHKHLELELEWQHLIKGKEF